MSIFKSFMNSKLGSPNQPEIQDESDEAKQFQNAVAKKSANKTSRTKKLTSIVGRMVANVQKPAKSKSVSFSATNGIQNNANSNANEYISYNDGDVFQEDEDDNESFLDPELEIVDLKGGVDNAPTSKTSKKNKRSKHFGFSRETNNDDDDGKLVLPEEQCDIPTFLHTKNCDQHLILETRRLLKERYERSPEFFYDEDYNRMMSDDWTVSRFLLRRRLDPKRTAKLMEECGKFRKQYKMSEVALWEFPIEFHKAGGLFRYSADRVGNITVYMRTKMYRKVPEISDVFKAFILCVLEEADRANSGRGVAVIFDLTGCGLQNVDLSFLSWLLSSFRNYCPKGVSYIIVYNLPWILNATCKLAMSWLSASNRRSLRFVHGDEIENFVARENLPDYLGGTCKINYRAIPPGSKPAIEVCGQLDMTREQALKIKELFREYLGEEDKDNNQTVINESINSGAFMDAEKTSDRHISHQRDPDDNDSAKMTSISNSGASDVDDFQESVEGIKINGQPIKSQDSELLGHATKFLAS